MNTNKRQCLDKIAALAGAVGYAVIRQNKHCVVDFFFGSNPVRASVSTTGSDVRAHRNVASDVRKTAKLRGLI